MSASTQNADGATLASGDRLSVAEFFRRWEAQPDLRNAELIEGRVYMSSPIGIRHDSHQGIIVGWLFTYALHTPGVEFGGSPTTRMLGSSPQPDGLLRIEHERGGQSRVKGDYLRGAPELIVEVSMSSAAHDLSEKKDLYARAGVREYVVLVLREREVRWFTSREGAFEATPLPEDGIYRSAVFPGLWLDARAAIEGDAARVIEALQQGLDSDAHTRFVNDLAAGKE